MAFLKLSAERINRRKVSRLSAGSRPVATCNWVMVVTTVAGLDSSTARSVQEGIGDTLDFRRHGRREEQGLARERHQLADALDVGDEAHVEHAVGFVDDQQLNAGEQQEAAL